MEPFNLPKSDQKPSVKHTGSAYELPNMDEMKFKNWETILKRKPEGFISTVSYVTRLFKSLNLYVFQCIVVTVGAGGFQTEPLYDQIKFEETNTRSGTQLQNNTRFVRLTQGSETRLSTHNFITRKMHWLLWSIWKPELNPSASKIWLNESQPKKYGQIRLSHSLD